MTWIVRRMRVDEAATLRETRLRALADAPTAFSTSLADARLRTDAEWTTLASDGALSPDRITFAAVEDGRWLGMAGAVVLDSAPATVQLVAMWVEPGARHRGIATGLIEAVVDWARGRVASQVRLGVTANNVQARALYERAGFVPTGRIETLRSQPSLSAIEMERSLRSPE